MGASYNILNFMLMLYLQYLICIYFSNLFFFPFLSCYAYDCLVFFYLFLFFISLSTSINNLSSVVQPIIIIGLHHCSTYSAPKNCPAVCNLMYLSPIVNLVFWLL